MNTTNGKNNNNNCPPSCCECEQRIGKRGYTMLHDSEFLINFGLYGDFLPCKPHTLDIYGFLSFGFQRITNSLSYTHTHKLSDTHTHTPRPVPITLTLSHTHTFILIYGLSIQIL